jgi:hypothetical protein
MFICVWHLLLVRWRLLKSDASLKEAVCAPPHVCLLALSLSVVVGRGTTLLEERGRLVHHRQGERERDGTGRKSQQAMTCDAFPTHRELELLLLLGE